MQSMGENCEHFKVSKVAGTHQTVLFTAVFSFGLMFVCFMFWFVVVVFGQIRN